MIVKARRIHALLDGLTKRRVAALLEIRPKKQKSGQRAASQCEE
jgi:hypothetical protein